MIKEEEAAFCRALIAVPEHGQQDQGQCGSLFLNRLPAAVLAGSTRSPRAFPFEVKWG